MAISIANFDNRNCAGCGCDSIPEVEIKMEIDFASESISVSELQTHARYIVSGKRQISFEGVVDGKQNVASECSFVCNRNGSVEISGQEAVFKHCQFSVQESDDACVAPVLEISDCKDVCFDSCIFDGCGINRSLLRCQQNLGQWNVTFRNCKICGFNVDGPLVSMWRLNVGDNVYLSLKFERVTVQDCKGGKLGFLRASAVKIVNSCFNQCYSHGPFICVDSSNYGKDEDETRLDGSEFADGCSIRELVHFDVVSQQPRNYCHLYQCRRVHFDFSQETNLDGGSFLGDNKWQ